MSHLGLGVMINSLNGDKETNFVISSSIGKTISNFDFTEDRMMIMFDDETKIQIKDIGQSCCEERYMVCDDDLTKFIGAKLTGIESRNVEIKENEYTTHEIAFFLIHTDQGDISIANHNEHNGYYGGFVIVAKFEN